MIRRTGRRWDLTCCSLERLYSVFVILTESVEDQRAGRATSELTGRQAKLREVTAGRGRVGASPRARLGSRTPASRQAASASVRKRTLSTPFRPQQTLHDNLRMDEIRKIPPVTRYLVGGTLAITLPILLQLVAIYPIVRLLVGSGRCCARHHHNWSLTISHSAAGLHPVCYYQGLGDLAAGDRVRVWRVRDRALVRHFLALSQLGRSGRATLPGQDCELQ
jgi:hypothetical protein